MYLIGRLIWCLLFSCVRLDITFNWVAASAVGTFLVVLVALIPTILKSFHRFKIRKVLKDLIYVDIRDLNESFQGKLNTFQETWKKKATFTAPIPKHDFSSFKTLVSNYKKSIYLSRNERILLGKLIRTFKRETYHKDIRPGEVDYTHYTYNVICKDGIKEIVSQTNTLLNMIEKDTD